MAIHATETSETFVGGLDTRAWNHTSPENAYPGIGLAPGQRTKMGQVPALLRELCGPLAKP